jgi:uncharacterized protein YjaG (DUF416 family)
MSNPELHSLDDYQQFITNTIEPWTREKRIALAAAVAERWLPVYESFSEEEEWGDPSILQRAVEAVWNCALGKKLTAKDQKLHKNRVDENTPHSDDFAVDMDEVIVTTAIIDYALDCCMKDDNTGDVVTALLYGLEAVAPGIYTEAGELPQDVLESPRFHDMMKKELNPLLDNLPEANEQEIDMYRQEIMSTPVFKEDGVGPLPADVWESPLVSQVLERVAKLRKGFSAIAPQIAEKMAAINQEFETPEVKAEVQQTALDAWKLPQVQNELKKQLETLELIGDLAQIDQKQIKALRRKLTSSDIVATKPPPPDRRMTNEAVFEQYRRFVEIDFKHQSDRENNKELMEAMAAFGQLPTHYLSEWAGRYSRRKLVLEGNQKHDIVGRNALLARYSKNDAATQGDPGWDEETRSSFERSYQYMPRGEGGIEARTPYQPHHYGPSLRQLCIERRLAGDSEQDVWNYITQWARHRPSAWDEEDQRKKKKLPYATPELGERLTRALSWRDTDDVNYPWTTEVDGETWRIALNDFPDDVMYTLIVDDKVIGKFQEWPQTWVRDMVG